MSPKAVAVVHRHAMVAEGIAAALGRYPQIVPIGATNSVQGLDGYAGRTDAVALDRYLRGAAAAARRLRRRGVRVVFLDGAGNGEGTRVSTDAPVATLAAALVPGAGTLRPYPSRLTPREQQVLSLVARGLAAKQVARQLSISPKTVERHKTRIFAKLGVPNQAAAVRAAMGHELGRSDAWISSNS
jgi:DNA-binding CsgD family transcriptional regulator